MDLLHFAIENNVCPYHTLAAATNLLVGWHETGGYSSLRISKPRWEDSVCAYQI